MGKKKVINQIYDVDLRLLRIFKTVVEFGGITPAENVLNISCSTITRHIKDLETKLGFVLCHRGRAGFKLSEDGQQVYEATNLLLHSINDFRTKMNQIHHELTGTLNIAVFDTISHMPEIGIAKAIETMRQKAPEVVMSITICALTETEQGLVDGRYDLGIIQCFKKSNAFEYYSICEMDFGLYCGPQHPLFTANYTNLTIDDITDYPVVNTRHYSNRKEKSHDLGFKQTSIANDEEGIVMFIASNQYLGFLPNTYAERFFIKRGLMKKVDIEGLNFSCECDVILNKQQKANVLAETFIGILFDEAKKNPQIMNNK